QPSGSWGVACVAASRCFELIGGISRWDGTSFTAEPLSGVGKVIPSAAYDDVSCASANACLAVGTYASGSGSALLASRWNGSAWALTADVPLDGSTDPSGAHLDCPSASACVVAV